MADPRPLRQRFRDAARVEILEAAERVFVRDGLMAARIDAVAAEAGVSVGTIYNLFGDRGGVVEALFEWRHADLREALESLHDVPKDTSFEPRVRAIVTGLFEKFRERWTFLRVAKQAEFAPDSPACGRGPHKSREQFQAMFARMVALMEQGIAEGRLRDVDAETAATAFLGLVRASFDVPLLRDHPTFDASPDVVVDLFLHGLARPKSRSSRS